VTLDPSSRRIDADGGERTVRIRTSSSCEWSAGVNVSWITLLRTRGQGEAELQYRVASNAGTARTGIVTVAGRTHAVEQAEARRRGGDDDDDD
jgi:hypothetical protein